MDNMWVLYGCYMDIIKDILVNIMDIMMVINMDVIWALLMVII